MASRPHMTLGLFDFSLVLLIIQSLQKSNRKTIKSAKKQMALLIFHTLSCFANFTLRLYAENN